LQFSVHRALGYRPVYLFMIIYARMRTRASVWQQQQQSLFACSSVTSNMCFI